MRKNKRDSSEQANAVHAAMQLVKCSGIAMLEQKHA